MSTLCPAIANSSVSVAPHIANKKPPFSTNCRMCSATSFLRAGILAKPSRRAVARLELVISMYHGTSR